MQRIAIITNFLSIFSFFPTLSVRVDCSVLRERDPVHLRVCAGGRQRRGGAGVARGAEDLGHHRGGHGGDAAALGKSTLHFTLTLCILHWAKNSKIHTKTCAPQQFVPSSITVFWMYQLQVEAEEYLAVFFTGPCEEKAKTDQVSWICTENVSSSLFAFAHFLGFSIFFSYFVLQGRR